MEIKLTGTHITLANTSPSELNALVEFEQSSEFIGENSIEEHLNLLNDPDCLHLTVKHIENNRLIGHIILNGVLNKNKSLEFRRIFIYENGKGFGREAIKLSKKICFDKLNFNRLWLDVHVDNVKAKKLYESEKFKREDSLREVLLTENGFKSIDIYSQLAMEYKNELE